MFKKAKIIAAGAVSTAALFIPSSVYAQTLLVPTQLTQQTNFILIVQAVIRVVLLLAFVLSFIFLLIGGIRWITSGGDEKAVAGARGMITAALIGLVIVLVAYALIRLVETFFNVSILTGGVCIPTIGGGCSSG